MSAECRKRHTESGRVSRFTRLCAVLCGLCILFAPLPGYGALFGEVTLSDEMKMGREFEVMVKTAMPLVEDPEVKLYVQSIVDRIVATLPPQPYKFQTNVILHPSLNAFAAPGGFVVVFTGLIQHLDHESELAGVLAHEIAHVTQRHVALRMERGQWISIATLLATALGVAAAQGDGNMTSAAIGAAAAAGQAAMLNYSRTDESDADQFGIQYLVAAGYNPAGLGGAFSKIQEQSWGHASSIPTYLSTHPDIPTRLTSLAARTQSMDASIRQRPQDDARFRRVQTLIWARYGDTAHAAQVFASRDPGDPLAAMGQGILAARQNRVKDAENAFETALRLAPKDPLILREAGIFHYNKGDIRLARQQLEAALAIERDDYYGLFFYARLLDDEGDSRGAQERYRRVLRFVPEDAEVHTYYGRSLGKSQQIFEGYVHLGYAAIYSNNEERAQEWIKRAKAAARTEDDRAALAKLEELMSQRQKIWRGR